MASRTTVRLTPNSSISSFSVGSWSPRLYWPDWMRSVTASISSRSVTVAAASHVRPPQAARS